MLPSLDSRSCVTPLMSSRPSTFTLTPGEAVLASMSLIRTEPVGAFESTSAPFWTENAVIASLSSWLSRVTSALPGLS